MKRCLFVPSLNRRHSFLYKKLLRGQVKVLKTVNVLAYMNMISLLLPTQRLSLYGLRFGKKLSIERMLFTVQSLTVCITVCVRHLNSYIWVEHYFIGKLHSRDCPIIESQPSSWGSSICTMVAPVRFWTQGLANAEQIPKPLSHRNDSWITNNLTSSFRGAFQVVKYFFPKLRVETRIFVLKY